MNAELTRGRDGRYNAVVAVEEKNRKIVAAVRRCAPAVLAALWAAPFIHHGSTKRAVPDMTDAVCVAGGEIDGGAGRPALPKGRTNGIPVGRDVPVAPAVATSASAASGAAASPEPATTADGRFRVAVRPATNGLARPDGVALFDRWRRRGAADDAFRLAPPGWWFRLPDGFSDGVTIFSRGEIRPAARTPYFPPVFADRVSLLPQARWHLLGAGAAESGLWHRITPANFFFSDSAEMNAPYPRLTADGVESSSPSDGWRDGHMTWGIPIGWAGRNVAEEGGAYVKLIPREYEQQFMIDRNGKVGVRKFGHQVTRDTNDTIRLDVTVVKSNGGDVPNVSGRSGVR